jgi:glycosyltransferase involved in cell wall biosynthesis
VSPGRRRLLVLAYFYPPLAGGGVHRVLAFTRHLPAHGWDCTVVCAGPGDYWVTDASLLERVPPATEVVRVQGGSALSAWLRLRRGDHGRRSGRTFSGLRALADWWLLPDSYAGWAGRARAVAMRRIAAGGIDAVLTTSPPDSVHLAGLELKRRHGLPWVADFRDPWFGLYMRDPPTAWHAARHAAMERAVMAGADLVLTASRTHAEGVGARSGARPREIEHLPNGFEAQGEVAEASPADATTFQMAFTGTLSQMPDAETFLEAVHEVLARRPEARRRLRARLAGPYDTDLADRALALGLTGIVEFTGPLPHADTRALQRGADVLLLWKPPGSPTMVPGKTYEYLDTGRPVIALLEAEDEAARLVTRAGGTVVPPRDRAALAARIEERYAAWREGQRPAPSRPGWLDEHRRDVLAARLAGMLDRVTGRGPAA